MAEKFEEKTSEGFEQKESGLYVPKEERGHIRSPKETEELREYIPEEKKIESKKGEEEKAKEWREMFSKCGGKRGLERIREAEKEIAEERKAMESAKIPDKEMETKEILEEAAPQKAVEQAKKDQQKRREKISSLQDVKDVGKGRLAKLIGGLSYIAALDKLGILGLKEGKKLAVEGGKELAVMGLIPAAAIEKAGRYVAGKIQASKAFEKGISRAGWEIQVLEKMPDEEKEKREYYPTALEELRLASEKASNELIRGYDKMYGKGKMVKLIERLLGGMQVELREPISRGLGLSEQKAKTPRKSEKETEK